jgi:hypothetical protein
VEILVKHIKISKTWGEDTDTGRIQAGYRQLYWNIGKQTLSLIDFYTVPHPGWLCG